MNLDSQNNIIWTTEGNDWLERNQSSEPSSEIFEAIQFLINNFFSPINRVELLEFGCSDGRNSEKLKQFNVSYFGVDPSEKAVFLGKKKGYNLRRGMAHNTNLGKKFDVVVLGFFMYLTHKDNWFDIVRNVDLHVKDHGFLIIKDFYSPKLQQSLYGHDEKLTVTKYDYSKLFAWHPNYNEIYRKTSSSSGSFEDANDYIQTVIMKIDRK